MSSVCLFQPVSHQHVVFHPSSHCSPQQTIVQMTWHCTWQTCLKPLLQCLCMSAFLSTAGGTTLYCCSLRRYSVVQATLTHHRNNCTLSCKIITDCSSNKGTVTYRLGGWGGSSSRWQRLHWGQRCTQSSSLVCSAYLLKHTASALHSQDIMLHTLDLAMAIHALACFCECPVLLHAV